jgi:hypothetical protein
VTTGGTAGGDGRRPLEAVRTTYANDPALANLVWALDGAKRHVRLASDPSTIRRLEESQLFAAIGDYCGLIHGAVPNGTRGLLAAHALFQGLNRPCLAPGRDAQIYVFVLNPDCSFVFHRSWKLTGTGPTKITKPDGSVFVVYADLVEGEYVTATGTKIATGGSVLFWEWVLADTAQSNLPVDHETRYVRRIW